MAIRRWTRLIGFVTATLACAGAVQAVSMYSFTALPTAFRSTDEISLNNNGQIVCGDYLWDQGVVTELGFSYTDLSYPAYSAHGSAQAINDSGQVAGDQRKSFYDSNYPSSWQGYTWQNGTGTLLPHYSPGDDVIVFDNNNNGQVVGRSDSQGGGFGSPMERSHPWVHCPVKL